MTDQEIRAINVETKMGAVMVAFVELGGAINTTKFAKQFMGMTGKDFDLCLSACRCRSKEQAFTPEQYEQLADAMRKLAKQLTTAAEEISAAIDE